MQVLVRLRWDTGAGVIEPFVPKGWVRHPAVLMWTGFVPVLAAYQDAVCAEWVSRGFADSCRFKTRALVTRAEDLGLADSAGRPPWLDDPAFHRGHQSNLIRKDPSFYGARFPGVPDDLPYVWPEPSVP